MHLLSLVVNGRGCMRFNAINENDYNAVSYNDRSI